MLCKTTRKTIDLFIKWVELGPKRLLRFRYNTAKVSTLTHGNILDSGCTKKKSPSSLYGNVSYYLSQFSRGWFFTPMFDINVIGCIVGKGTLSLNELAALWTHGLSKQQYLQICQLLLRCQNLDFSTNKGTQIQNKTKYDEMLETTEISMALLGEIETCLNKKFS